MNIGYACLTVGVPHTDQKSCMLKNASQEKLTELIAHNLDSLENIIDYNIKNNIKLFRISSDLIPFGSSPVNTLHWWDLFEADFLKIGEKIRNSGMRVSMHPGQYTVLNSTDEGVVKRAVEDLNYHAKVLDSLGVNKAHKIVLHIGGIYGDKKSAISRFIANYRNLDDEVKQRIVIENDDKAYNTCDVLEIGMMLNVPVIFDNLHNEINSCDKGKQDLFWINQCRKTWKEKDGLQKIHYSQQDPRKRPGSHSGFIRINEFMDFYKKLEGNDIDIMLEVKDKNLSAVKCINCTSSEKNTKVLESEWSKYKYNVLEKSPDDYTEITELLRNKGNYPAVPFYNLIEDALQRQTSVGNYVNAAQHAWGYLKDKASDKEKENFLKSIEDYEQGKTSQRAVKNNLRRIAVKYQHKYILESYYFVL